MIDYTYSQFVKDIRQIAYWVQSWEEVTTPGMKWQPNNIISITRGGLVPGVHLSHILNIRNTPVTWQTRDGAIRESIPYTSDYDQILIVDDINDTGMTFRQILDDVKSRGMDPERMRQNIKVVSLWNRYTSQFRVDFTTNKIDTDDWINFPWEQKIDESPRL